MKKLIAFTITLTCLFSICSFSSFANKKDLIDANDELAEIETQAEDILWRVNHGGASADIPRNITEDDIDFEKIYRIYSCSDIFEKKTDKASDIMEILNESSYIWQIPMFIDGSTVLFDFSKVTYIKEDLPEDIKESLEEIRGLWTPGAIYTYKNEIVDLVSNVEASLIDAGLNPEDYTYEFVSGIPGIRYPVAVVFDEQQARFIIPAKKATVRAFEGDWETVNMKNTILAATPSDATPSDATPSDAKPSSYNSTGDGFPVYDFNDVADASRHSSSIGLGGVGLKPYKANPAVPIVGGTAGAAALFLAGRFLRRRHIF